MKRAKQLELVQRATQHAERDRAESLVRAEQDLGACEMKLAELTRYRADYELSLGEAEGARQDVTRIRDFQIFLARLGEAIEQQRMLVERARARRDLQYNNWRYTAQRARAVGTLAKRWQTEDRRAGERKEQGEADERAQRAAHRGLNQLAESDQPASTQSGSGQSGEVR
ncbi:MAG: flagellar FliJ family protein [Pseudomonadales bacterium]|nr:flagellar FliJ family protein [Pseudomonadales bacterium]